jgi:hypothetical protein
MTQLKLRTQEAAAALRDIGENNGAEEGNYPKSGQQS